LKTAFTTCYSQERLKVWSQSMQRCKATVNFNLVGEKIVKRAILKIQVVFEGN